MLAWKKSASSLWSQRRDGLLNLRFWREVVGHLSYSNDLAFSEARDLDLLKPLKRLGRRLFTNDTWVLKAVMNWLQASTQIYSTSAWMPWCTAGTGVLMSIGTMLTIKVYGGILMSSRCSASLFRSASFVAISSASCNRRVNFVSVYRHVEERFCPGELLLPRFLNNPNLYFWCPQIKL